MYFTRWLFCYVRQVKVTHGTATRTYYLNQCWNFDDWTLRKKLQWNFNLNSHISINEIAKIAAIWSRWRWVNAHGLKIADENLNWDCVITLGKLSKWVFIIFSFTNSKQNPSPHHTQHTHKHTAPTMCSRLDHLAAPPPPLWANIHAVT